MSLQEKMDRYAQIKQDIIDLELEQLELNGEIKSELLDNDIRKSEQDYGIFNVVHKGIWKYNDNTKQLIKESKKNFEIEAQQNNTAEYVEGDYLELRLIKE